jgi:hypothetical protein
LESILLLCITADQSGIFLSSLRLWKVDVMDRFLLQNPCSEIRTSIPHIIPEIKLRLFRKMKVPLGDAKALVELIHDDVRPHHSPVVSNLPRR